MTAEKTEEQLAIECADAAKIFVHACDNWEPDALPARQFLLTLARCTILADREQWGDDDAN